MAIKLLMPELGESVVEGVVEEWFKQVGDSVKTGEPIVLMETEKVTTEVESPADGVLLSILADVGTSVAVGDLLGWIGAEGEVVPSATGAPDLKMNAPVAPVETALPAAGKAANRKELGGKFVSPVVARMAAVHNLDLAQINGSGRKGRVTKKDVLAFLDRQPSAEPAPAAVSTTAVSQPAPSKPAPTSVSMAGKDGELLPLSPMRRAIAQNMVNSKQTVPHVTAVVEVDLQKVAAHRQAHKAAFAQDGVKLTFMAYFATAVSQALKRHRMVNSSWTDEGIFLHRPVNLGIATDLGGKGLVVPVIKNADDLSLLGLARAIGENAERARSGKLKADDLKGGTYTLSNYGSNGTLMASPIINPPQCAILGLGKIERRPVVRQLAGEEVVVVRPMIYITHTYDHRILDGGTSAAFMRDLVEILEGWQ
ncbi:MAG: dihydrolipoamide acetyltransferase family protein [Chloroflexota bacterium]